MITKEQAMRNLEKKEKHTVQLIEQAIDCAIVDRFDRGHISINIPKDKILSEIIKRHIHIMYNNGGWEIEFVTDPDGRERIRIA